MATNVQYTPKTGIYAGRKCFPAAFSNIFKSGMYHLEKMESDGKTKTIEADDIYGSNVSPVLKGCGENVRGGDSRQKIHALATL